MYSCSTCNRLPFVEHRILRRSNPALSSVHTMASLGRNGLAVGRNVATSTCSTPVIVRARIDLTAEVPQAKTSSSLGTPRSQDCRWANTNKHREITADTMGGSMGLVSATGRASAVAGFGSATTGQDLTLTL